MFSKAKFEFLLGFGITAVNFKLHVQINTSWLWDQEVYLIET